ncbi:hypothetical protein [Bradyrhizobium sp. JYMT SZCCT0180]|uniref:hypothetical protein n=1 Tax=Bradyrhizobium sp. JYMT SZCCT0180 TaxID=2807666 RepID=UPI001BA93041|nr:hypothetical protein [Bradyrhizobium sp. JYMT SZCCT0180]MBR1214642.1 hypothetical protein [Bradyrhizobium sp. JYMT SZCCT0180]
MRNYFAMLGAKAIGAEIGIRARREVLYGSPRSADGLDSGRHIAEAAATRDQGEFAVGDAVNQPGTTVDAIQASAEAGEGDSYRADPEGKFSRDDRSALAMALQIYALEQRVANRGDAARRTVGVSAIPTADRPQQARPSSNVLTGDSAADRSDVASVAAPVPGAQPGQAERPKFKSVDQGLRRLGAEADSRIKPADEVESVLDSAPANAVHRSATNEANAARNVPRISQLAASTVTDRPDPTTPPHAGLTTVVLASNPANSTARAPTDAPSEARAEELPRVTGGRARIAIQPQLRNAIKLKEATGDVHQEETVFLSSELQEKNRLPVVSAHVGRPQSAPDRSGRGTPADLMVQDAHPSVQVNVGRIEIREQRLAPPAAVRRAQSPRMDLKEYLNRRLRGGTS